MINWIKTRFTFKGRMTRKSFWLTMLAAVVVVYASIAPTIIYPESDGAISIFFVAVVLATWVRFASLAKRSRDFNESPWYSLTTIIPLIGWIFFFVIGLSKTKDGEAK